MKKIILTSLLSLTTMLLAQAQQKISADSLPVSVKEQLHKNFHDYSITEVIKSTDKSGGVIYQVEVKKKKSEQVTMVYHLIYDAAGKLAEKKKDKEFVYTGNEPVKSKPADDGHSGHHH